MVQGVSDMATALTKRWRVVNLPRKTVPTMEASLRTQLDAPLHCAPNRPRTQLDLAVDIVGITEPPAQLTLEH